MGLFSIFKHEEDHVEETPKPQQMHACCRGRIINIETVSDQTFAKKLMGDGIAIIPSDGQIFAPCDGEIILLPDTLHAYAIRSTNGLESLIHIGIDTVERNGDGFKSHVKEGQKVHQGQLVISFDYEQFQKDQVDFTTMQIITNEVEYDLRKMLRSGDATLDTIVFSYDLKRSEADE